MTKNYLAYLLSATVANLALSTFTLANESSEEGSAQNKEVVQSTAKQQNTTYIKSHRFMLTAGITGQGDELGKVDTISSFGSSDTETIYAGSLLYLGAGFEFFLDRDLSLETLIGYHFDMVTADNGSVGFYRLPIDLNLMKKIDQHRIGLGASYHVGPELDLVDGQGPMVKFDDALGISVNYGYEFDQFILGFKYLSIDYELESIDGVSVTSAEDVDGSYFGVFISVVGW